MQIGVDGGTGEQIYKIRGSEKRDDIVTFLEPKIPAFMVINSTIHGQVRLVYQNYKIEHEGNGLWIGTVNYLRRAPQFTFDTTGGKQHITQALSTTRYPDSSAQNPAPDCKDAIGVRGDRVEGVDIVVPQFAFSETHVFQASQITVDYVTKLFKLTGHTNDAPWTSTQGYEFDTGEALFLGASGTQRGADDVEITFKFLGSPNVGDISIGDIFVDQKSGHDYLWTMYGDADDRSVLVQQAIGVYVATVYHDGDFGDLVPPPAP